MNSSFKRNLLVLYSISFLLLIVSAIASYISINNLLDSQDSVNQTNAIINKLDNVISILKDAETGQRGFLLTGKDEFLEPYTGALDKANTLLDETKARTVTNINQQQSAELLRDVIKKRISTLQVLIDKKREGINASVEELENGKLYMDSARNIVQTMEDRERSELETHTASMKKFAASTPTLIIIASLLSFLVALVSFLRINNDFKKREKLQVELINKDEDITNRLNLIQNIAEKISSGNYKTRLSDEGKDVLGYLSVSLNKMAESLDYSFTNLSHNEWLQSGIAGLNDKMIGEKNLSTLTYNVLDFIAGYVEAPVAAFYLAEDNKLTLSAGIALDENIKKEIIFGEGLAGQSALSGKEIFLKDISETNVIVSYAAGKIKPTAIIAVPVFYEGKLKGVIELASLKEISTIAQDFLKSSTYNIGMAINAARENQRLQELLGETQAQSEELQAQHNEMENINAELEVQAEKLQASEEELKVQQEELQQSNTELEERSRLLEEKNELILERNFEIQAKAEQLELITKYKSEFLANMSHELRTPLNSILLLSRLLSENHGNNLSNDEIEYATIIQNSGTSLLTLINEILDLSKIESGKMELEYSQVTIKDLMRGVKDLFEPVAKDKDITFNLHADDELQQIETDRLRLDQILRNLISNALKFTKQGSVTLNIEKDNEAFSFIVKDTGIGIPKDKLETIFEAFQQADGSTKRQYGGTGLGLSISRELAKLLGGVITVTSEEGKGSEFKLTIPAKKNAAHIVAPQNESLFRTNAEVESYNVPEIKRHDKNYISEIIPASVADDRHDIETGDKVILIVEDDTGFAKSLLDFTRQKNYKGIVAVRGDEGVNLAKKYHPHGILLDLQLPVKSGWEVMDELKSDPATKPIPIHIMSSHEVKNISLSSGAADFISKPVAFERMSAVFQKIEDALSRHPKKVMIVEENEMHAKALAYFLESFNVVSEITNSIKESINTLNKENVDCVILDMAISTQGSYDILGEVRKAPGFEDLPIIVFTGKNLSYTEEMHIKQYADSIVVKTAHSYQRILDEVSLFLHLVEQNKNDKKSPKYKRMGELAEVLKGKTVLVADDDVRNIFSLTKSLENYGMNVISAIDGKDALKQLSEHKKIDIVLMDMMMPEMDGYESTKRIRENPKYKNLPVIAVTAKAMMGDREKCINAGASDYITKPVDADQLISLLRVWLYQ
jgi:signal transduction histidine kinase/DNA-binding response OmpR family regulator/CHASE3 domain sensor protein